MNIASRLSLTIFAIAALCSCESTGLYQWGNYETDLYNYYNKPTSREAVVEQHLAYVARLEQNDQRVPPGIYAEAGTYLLEQGNIARAREFYQKERDTWPESNVFMGVLIDSLDVGQDENVQ